MCANTIKHGIFSLTSLLPDVKHFLCPIINAAYTKQVNNECQLLRPMYNEDDQFGMHFFLLMAEQKTIMWKMIVHILL